MKNLSFLLFGLCILALHSCEQSDTGKILTVNGPIDPSELGTVLSHEHILVDFIGADSTGYHRWNKDTVLGVVLPYLEECKAYGVKTIVECSPAFLGRDPELLRMLAKASGLQILTNTGYYGARENKFIPEDVFSMSPEELAAIWISEFEDGIEGSGIRPGFIKIGVDRNDTLSEEHRLLINAAALAHKETGLVIASHTGPEAPAFEQLAVLENEGVSPSAFIWVHANRGSLSANIKAAQMGAWVSLDNYNLKRDSKAENAFNTPWYIERLLALRDAGVLDHVLLSHDAGWYRPGEPGGGDFRGYTDIFTSLLPMLKESGFTSKEIDQLMIENPGKAFAVR